MYSMGIRAAGDSTGSFLLHGRSGSGKGWEKRMEERKLPSAYYIDESDPDILLLRRQDGTFVAAFSSQGATRDGIVEAAMEDYKTLNAQ
jgi:hypothetical protein